jgi:GNAT superfamily N-acetyltransferase
MDPFFDTHDDGAGFQSAIADWLIADPAAYALVCGVARLPGAWRGVVRASGSPRLAVACTPPWPAVLASPLPIDGAVVTCIAGQLARRSDITGVNGPVAWAEAVTKAVNRPLADRMDMRLHRLEGAPLIPHPVEGAARPFRDDEVPLVKAWLTAFDVECGEPPNSLDDKAVQALLPDCLAWTLADAPVAMARQVRPLLGGHAISSVYTPPAFRRRGFAGAVVQAFCVRLLANGDTYISLYTDLAMPTANRLYARIGFRPVLDVARLRWSP